MSVVSGFEEPRGAVGAVWALRWRLVFARGRLLAWNVGVPIALLAPVALSPAAAPHRAAVYAVFVVLFGTFGACIPHVRDGQAGWSEKVMLGGYGARRWLAERTAAEGLVDALELSPALAALWLAEGGGAVQGVLLVAAALIALVAANLLGTLVAGLVRSLAEGALASAAIALVALHLAGVFRPAGPGSWAAATERWSPFRPLHEALLGLAPPAGSGSAGAESWGPPIVATAGLAALLLATAPALGSRLRAGRSGD